MARVDRMLVGLPLLALVLVVLGRMRNASDEIAAAAERASAASPADAGTSAEVQALLGQFLAGLDRLRRSSGAIDPVEKRSLEELVERLCTRFDRCDARAVLAYYLRLSPDERRIGLEEEARCEELRQRVLAAAKNGLDEDGWKPLREEVLAGLYDIAGRARAAADSVPAARALSLSARLGMERIQRTPAQDEDAANEARRRVEKEALEALALYERSGFLRPRLEPIWVLACLDLAVHDTLAARARFESSLAIARRVRDVDFQENALVGLIQIARDAGDVAETRRHIFELAGFRTPEKSWPLARWHADYLLQRDEPQAAIEFLEAHRPADPGEQGAWHLELAAAARRSGDLERANEHVALVGVERTSQDELLVVRSDLDLARGAAFEVIDQLDHPDVLQRLGRQKRAQAHALIGEAHVRLQRYEAAIEPFKASLAIGARWQTRLEGQRDAIESSTSVIGEQVGLHAVALLAECLARTARPLEAARVIEAHQSPMLRRAERARAAGAPPADAPVDADLAAWASAFDLGLVTWVVGADSSVVAHVARDGSARAEPIARGRIALEAAVRRLCEAVIAGDEASIARLAREMRVAILPDPIFDALQNGARGRLLCVLHGPLEKLPIELVLETVLAGNEIVPLVLPGLPAPAPGEPLGPAALSEWTLSGDPIDPSGVARLPGAREEILAIARLRGPQAPMHVGGAFDRAAFASALAGDRALHVATHLARRAEDYGRFDALGLRLSNGDVFEAREISAARPALPLAVLAACETAEGRFIDAEGLQGVARAFLESGTRNLLVTLWPIADQAALPFSLEFHRALIAGSRPSEAAAIARRALRKGGFTPADWAAFRLIGRD